MSKECPQCGKIYEPSMSKKKAKESGKNIIVEQHMTGICSRECYLRYVGSFLDYRTHKDSLPNHMKDKSKTNLVRGLAQETKMPVYLTVEEVGDGEIKERIADALPIEINNGKVKIDELIENFNNISTEEELNDLLDNKIAYIQH